MRLACATGCTRSETMSYAPAAWLASWCRVALSRVVFVLQAHAMARQYLSGRWQESGTGMRYVPKRHDSQWRLEGCGLGTV